MSNSGDPLKFDVRTIERNIKYGKLARKEVQEHIDTLPDVSQKAITLGEIEDSRVTERVETESSADSAPQAVVPTE